MSALLRSGFTVACLKQTSVSVGWAFWVDRQKRKKATQKAAKASKAIAVVDFGGDM